MASALDYKVIDIHVHVTPWDMLNLAAAALMEATQPNHVLLHELITTGTSMFKGARNRFADPMPVHDVAVDFPDLKIIIAHAGRPLYTDTSFLLLRRNPNVSRDISSVPPKSLLPYYPWLERVADKVMFGSDWPGPGVRDIAENIQQFLSLDLSDEVKRMILRDNAIRISSLAEH
jgi:predicted TIM-barrel fold metal-dependent hydrolase